LFQAERLAVTGQLLASVSHELNNPLQAIETALFLLREQKNLSQQMDQELGIILSETERMTTIPVIACNPDQMRQVMLNLFMNAVEAMPDGGALTVQTCFQPEPGRVIISVADTGTGFAPDIQPHLFEPFFTSKPNGSGLGLSITHDIVLQHQGEIRAVNNAERGATLTVWLPIRRLA
jgi:two-component system NtrC family sensor kinase